MLINYNITDKADGTRGLIFIDKGKGYLFYRGNQSIELQIKDYKKTLVLDCEFIEELSLCLLFDVIAIDDINFIKEGVGIEERIKKLRPACDIIEKQVTTEIKFKMKTYVSLAIPERYKQVYTDMYKTELEYKKDGLILVQKGRSYPITKSFKWKPTDEQTIDFYIKKCPENYLGTQYGPFKNIKEHTLYFLYNGINSQLQKHLKIFPHPGYDIIFPDKELDPSKVTPIQFTMSIAPLSYLYYHPDNSSIKNIDGAIGELTCNKCLIYREEGESVQVDWKLTRLRTDKTIIPGKEYGNFYTVAYDIYLNHIEPFPLELLHNSDMLTSTSYFLNKRSKDTVYAAQTSVINYMKSVAISKYTKANTNVLDIGSGRGADIAKYIHGQVGILVVTDIDKSALTELLRRWLTLAKSHSTPINTTLKAVVINMNEDIEENIIKLNTITGSLKYETVYCHLAAHYFAVSMDSLIQFAAFCKRVTENKAYLVFSIPIGDKIFELLKDRYEWNVVQDGMVKYSIKKDYKDTTFSSAGQNIKILLPFSQQNYYTEPLINISTWKEVFKDAGFGFVSLTSGSAYIEGFKTKNMKKFEQLKEGDLQFIDLYGVLVFKKDV